MTVTKLGPRRDTLRPAPHGTELRMGIAMKLVLMVLSVVLLNGCAGLGDSIVGGLAALGPKAQYSHGLGVPFAADTLYFAVQKKGTGFDPWGSIQRIDLDGQ